MSRSERAIYFIGSTRERITSRRRSSRNLPAEVAELKRAAANLYHKPIQTRAARQLKVYCPEAARDHRWARSSRLGRYVPIDRMEAITNREILLSV